MNQNSFCKKEKKDYLKLSHISRSKLLDTSINLVSKNQTVCYIIMALYYWNYKPTMRKKN